jgi:DNA-binding HxlR family transcriptional regulator
MGGVSLGRDCNQVEAYRAQARHCSLPSALDLIGERWAFLILRGAFNGLRQFEDFQACLGIARNILSDRLAKMVAGGILERTQDPADRRCVIYALTKKGEGLLPTVLALRQWGMDWGHGDAKRFIADRQDGRPIARIAIRAQDGRELDLAELAWMDEGEVSSPAVLLATPSTPKAA